MAEPVKVPHNGRTCSGDQATATRIRLRLPTILIGRIEVNPAGARQVSLHPRVSCAAARDARIVAGNEDIPADEASGQAKGARRFHHKHGEVPATAATALERFVRALHALLTAPRIEELFSDTECHGAKQVHGSGDPGRIQKLACPTTNVIAWIVMDQRAGEVWQIVIRIAERIGYSRTPPADTPARWFRNAPASRCFQSEVPKWNHRMSATATELSNTSWSQRRRAGLGVMLKLVLRSLRS